MFEEYDFAGVYIAIQAVLTLYAQGMLIDTHILLHTAPLAWYAWPKVQPRGGRARGLGRQVLWTAT